jgi:hypothetical protein
MHSVLVSLSCSCLVIANLSNLYVELGRQIAY